MPRYACDNCDIPQAPYSAGIHVEDPIYRAMFRRILIFLALCAVISVSPFGVAANAYADGCLSPGEARAAAQSGEIVPLSRIIGQIRAAANGEILPPPQLCNIGGHYVYLVNVLTRGGQVTRLTVDASSGSILDY
jgi:hypothetical protein